MILEEDTRKIYIEKIKNMIYRETLKTRLTKESPGRVPTHACSHGMTGMGKQCKPRGKETGHREFDRNIE